MSAEATSALSAALGDNASLVSEEVKRREKEKKKEEVAFDGVAPGQSNS